MTRTSARGLPHVGALDGLRALAVAGVVAYHFGAAVPGGFLGVDLFFVLSGYLITVLLLGEHRRSGRIDYVAFWGRRLRRLLPALLALLVAVAVAAWAWLPAVDRRQLRGDGIATIGYVANWHFIAASRGYFAQYGDPSPLLHTWSLAIEEQFYLLWPILVILALRSRRGRAVVATVAGCGAVASAAWMAALYDPAQDPSRVYFGTDTRAQVILVGAVLAVVLEGRVGVARSRAARVLSGMAGAGALAAVIALMLTTSDHDPWMYRGGFLLFAAVAAVLIASVVVAAQTPVSRLFAIPVLRGLGRISYGVYLWHWPVEIFLDHERTGVAGGELLALRVVTTLVLATASYRFIERPILRGRAAQRRRHRMLAPISVVTTIGVLIGGTASAPAAQLTPTKRPELPASALGRIDGRTDGRHQHVMHRRRGPLRVVVLGDSVAETLALGLPDVPGRNGVTVIDDGTVGCGVTTLSPYRYFGALHARQRRCRSWQHYWARVVRRDRADIVLVVVGRWEVMDQELHGRWTHIGDPAYDAYLVRQLDAGYAAAASTGKPVAFATAPYYHRGERPDGGSWPEDDPRRVDAYNAILRTVVAAHAPGAAIVDLNARTAGGRHAYVNVMHGMTLRYDGVHFTPAASRWLAPWLYRRLLRIVMQRA